METKRCGHCGKDKPIEDFWNDKSRSDGKAHTCKTCMKEYQDSHKEQTARNGKEYYQKNKTRVNARHAKWKLDNYDKKIEKDREWRINNKDRIKDLQDAWRKSNAAYIKEKTRRDYLKNKYGITEEIFQQLFNRQKGLCGVCTIPLLEAYRICIDHCHGTGHIRGLLCNNCNCAEGMLRTIQNVERLLAYMKKNEIFYFNGNPT